MSICALSSARHLHRRGVQDGVVGRPLSELFDFVKDKMPKNEPGSLTPCEYIQVARLPAQRSTAPPHPARPSCMPDTDALKKIRLDSARRATDQDISPMPRIVQTSLACLRRLGFGAFPVSGDQSRAAPPGARARQPAGEWRYWGGDAWSTRYSPLDQINADELRQAEDGLAVERQRLARRVLPHHPALRQRTPFTVATTRRVAAAIDPENGETLWMWRMDEDSLAESPASVCWTRPGLLDRRQEERVIVTTPGITWRARCEDRPPDPKFGKNGIVDLMDGLGFPLVPLAVDDPGPLIISDAAPARKAKPGETWDEKTGTGADGTVGIDPALGQIGVSCPAIIVNDVIIVGNSHIHGYYPIRLRNMPSYIRGFDVRTGKQLWKFNLVPEPANSARRRGRTDRRRARRASGKPTLGPPTRRIRNLALCTSRSACR